MTATSFARAWVAFRFFLLSFSFFPVGFFDCSDRPLLCFKKKETTADDYDFLVKTKKNKKKTTTTTKGKKEEAKPSGKASVAEGSSKKRARK